ncbi:MAG: hypothetical protein ABFD50_18055 [Smithella sp.]
MRNLRLLILTVLFLVSCQTLPAVNSDPHRSASYNSACPSPFLKQPYRLVHTIEARVAGKTQGAIIGVTLVDPKTRFVSCAIMTAEGMVLLEARAAPELEVIRALPPFNSADFAKNMIEDIKLIFLAPESEIKIKGVLSDGAHVCRWQAKSGDWIDVISKTSEEMEINRYSECGSLQRRIKINPGSGNNYQYIELSAKETLNYSLKMTLIEAELLEGSLKTGKTAGSIE